MGEGVHMRNTKKTKKKKINFKTFLCRFFFIGAVGYICFVLISQQVDLSSLKDRAAQLDAQISEQQREAKENESLKEIAGTDEFAASIARERLGFMKPNERVFIASTGE